MIVSLILIALITAGGFAITYLFEADEPFLWRIAAGNVAGCSVFGTAAFVVASLFGSSGATVIASLAVTLLPLLLFSRKTVRQKLDRDLAKAKGKLDGANFRKFLRFGYYAAFFLLFLLFFDRSMFETQQGIFTGGSQNLGDLPFHLGAIYSFLDGANFPPQNPNFAGAAFSYPFIADLLTANFAVLGASVRDAMYAQNVTWAFSLLVILERFAFRLLGDVAASKLVPALLFLSGGLGFAAFFVDWSNGSSGLFEHLFQLKHDFTINDQYRWGNSLVTLFMTQRSLLLGMPAALIILGKLWDWCSASLTKRVAAETSRGGRRDSLVPAIVLGIFAGTLVLIHLHSLAVLFVASAFYFAFSPSDWRRWLIFAFATALIAVPEALWSITGSATNASDFISWHFGWDAKDENLIVFWLRNTGVLIPAIAAGIYLAFRRGSFEAKTVKQRDETTHGHGHLLVFYLPMVFLFIAANVAKFAPWEWDNIKILIYWFAASLPFVASALMWLWRRSPRMRAVAIAVFLALTLAGSLDVWRVITRQINYNVFDADAIAVADRIKASTPKRALFVNPPTYNSAVVLSGRPSFIRYPGHLSSHGIDYREREDAVKTIYRGGPAALALIEKYGIDYVLISPQVRAELGPNEQFFARYPIAAEAGQYRVFKVR